MKKYIILLLVVLLAVPASSLAIDEDLLPGTWISIVELENGDYFLTLYNFFPDHTVYFLSKEVSDGKIDSGIEQLYKWDVDYGNIIIWQDDLHHYVLEYSDKDNVLYGGTFNERYRLVYSRYRSGW